MTHMTREKVRRKYQSQKNDRDEREEVKKISKKELRMKQQGAEKRDFGR